MFCVNVKSKEFKEACNRLNIHPSSLEVIVFQYLNNIGPESFPSDEYIMSKLEGKAMTDASESQILLWEKAYSTPKVFSDRASVGAFIKEASKYFSPESISIHRNNEGQYVASVTRPENREAYEKELKSILDKAPRNKEGKLLAPNGKPTKLSERQYAQVRTKAFKKWFGDWTKITKNEDGTWNIPADVSKVIDEETGEPKVVYHGSPNTTFTVFDKEKIGSNTDGGFYGRGFYFSEDKGISNKYGKEREFFLNIKNPYEINPDKIGWDEADRRAHIVPNFNAKESTPYDSELSKYDGVLQTLIENGEVLYMAEIVVPNANQIKSATDNVGTFSESSSDIRYSFIGEVGATALDALEEASTRISNLNIARQMEEQGKDPLAIKVATNWERGKDGLWRYEIMEGFPSDIRERLEANVGNTLSIGEILGEDSPIIKAYQFIKDAPIKIYKKENSAEGGAWNPERNDMALNAAGLFNEDGTWESPESIMAHEIQHAIQTKEGFAFGGNPFLAPGDPVAEKAISELNSLIYKVAAPLSKSVTIDGKADRILYKEDVEKYMSENELSEVQRKALESVISRGDISTSEFSALILEHVKPYQEVEEAVSFENYTKIAGEVESRNVQTRLDMSIDERRNTLASQTEDVAREDQIILENLIEESDGTSSVGIIDYRTGRPNISSVILQGGSNSLVLEYLTNYFNKIIGISVIHKWNGEYYLTKTAFDGGNTKSVEYAYDRAKELISSYLVAENIPKNIIEYEDLENSIRVRVNKEAVRDTIIRSRESIKVEKLFNKEEAKKVLSVLDFLSNKTGLTYKVISEKEAIDIIGTGKGIKKVNAFVQGDTCYFIEGRQLNVDIAAEEMLHPFIASIRKSNPTAFKSLLKDAQKAFPTLRLEIARDYKGRPVEEIQEELVTQALSRAFREDIKNTPEGHSVKELIKNFINRIVEIFQSFFGENNSEVITEYKTRVDEILEREEITAQDLQSTITINELAEIVNSGLKMYSPNINGTRMNQTEESTNIESIEVETKKNTEEQFMENQQALIREIENLNELGLSQSEVRHLGEQLMWWISDHLTVLQTTLGELERVYGIGEAQLKGRDVTKLSRKEIAELVTPDRLMFQCMRAFTGRSGMTPRQALKIKKIANNFKALMFLSSSTFSDIEGFGLIEPGADFGIMSEIKFTPEDFNNADDIDTIMENEGDIQQHWQVNFRTLDVLDHMTPEVRLELLKCYQLDKKGNPIISEYGIKERINARQAVNTILRICQGRNDLPSMIKKMKENVNTYPWLQQIITRLEDESRQNDNFKSAFFTTFCKPFVSYSVTRKNKDGVYESIIVNEFPALREAVNSVTTKYKMNQHPMFNNEGVTDDFREVKKIYESLREAKFAELNLEELKNKLTYVYNALGYDITPDFIEPLLDEKTVKDIVTNLGYVVNSVEQGFFKLGSTYDPFKFRGDYNILTSVRNILRKVSEQLEDTSVASTYDNGKMYQSYVTQSFLSKLMSKFQEEDDAEFEKFIKEEYGNYEWFTNSDGTFRNSWLELLATDPKYRSIFKHKVQLNFNKKNYMRNMSKSEYVMSMITEYFSELDKDNNFSVAWYRVPMMSNKPSSEFIRFVSYNNVDYKTQITKKLFDVFLQELSRIQTVEMRGLSKGDPKYIKNFDSNGKKFCFLDTFNDYLTGNKTRVDEKTGFELGKLIRKKLDGKKIPGTDKVLTTSEELVLRELAIAEIKESMDARADKIFAEWKESGITDKCSSIKGVGTAEEVIEENLRKFIWNDTLAAINIIQMTVTDIAYYKDAEDLQKRFAQIHSPGVRANRYAKWNGEEVSDGYVRTVYLTDFEKVVSNVIENISIVFDNKIKAAKETAKAEGRNPENDNEVKSLEALKESLVGEKGLYRQINVTDAQGYSSATSYRKKAIMFGKWSEVSEATYNKLMEGDFTATDLQVAFQPLKPFVYTQISKSSEVASSPMTNLKVPIQNKNSEYLLVLADAILQEQNTGKPNLLRVINEVMEDSAKRNHRAGIDTVQFTSAVKSGLMGEIDITGAETEEEAREILEKAIYEGTTTSEPYSTNRVHKIPVEDYCIQQEVPAHFRDHEQAHGSQTRAIVIADLLDFYPNGEEVMYTYKEGSVEKSVNRKDFIREYEETIAENIQDSINRLAEELHIDVGTDRKSRNLALSKILQREILSNPSRYGTDLLIACSVNEDGEFRIPLGDPIQSKRVEQLINSIIKNRINKQTLPGGPVVQVSNFGTSRQLSIKFKNKDGVALDTYEEWISKKENKGKSKADYKKYISDNQAGIAYLECFAPAYTRDLFSKFIDEDGNLDVEAIEATDPNLLKMIGYRIPTEDKYSISPLKIVGFLPREAGDGIMLPYDITLLNGSDFDIDKMYVMFKDLKVRKKKFDKKNETSTLFKGVQNKIYQALLDSRGNNGYNQEEITKDAVKLAAIFLNKKIKVEEKRVAIAEIESKYSEKWKVKVKDLYKAASRGYRASRYESVQPTNNRALRNNKIVDMTYAVMTHETTVDKMLNPGGFDQQKAMGYKVAAFNVLAAEVTDESTLLKIWEDLSSKSIDDLKDLASKDKNLCFIDTHTQFYDQNNAAGALIGIFAVHKVAHAFLGNDGFIYRGEFAPFTIAGNTISPGIPIDPEKDFRGQYVGKVLGSLVASAADAVKDPILNLMNINSETAITLCTMVRLGIPFDTAAMFLSQKVIGDILREKANKNIDGYTSLSEIIKNKLADLEKTHGISSDSSINTGELTMEELIVGIKGGNPAIEYKVLTTLATIMNINNDMRGLSYLTRFNSISNAVGPLIIDNLLMEEKLANFPDTIYSQEGVKLNAIDVLRRHPILNKFHETISIAHHLFGEMPTNSDNFRDILRNIPGSLREVVMRDRKLLSSISDFYQSYMLINSGAIDYSKLSYYINDFPKEYVEIISENPELKNNALIRAIRLAVDDKSGKPILKIDTTGIERDYKESLSSGWADLVKTNKELAIQLFHYNFFKGGIVFNPKTFMGLAPNKVKENIDGYVETYRNSPALDTVHFLDLFIRNNWSEYKLVPRLDISLKTSDIKSGKVSFTKIEDIEAIGDKRYFRVKLGKSDLLLRISYVSDSEIKADVISPLGNNKEYLEMSTEEITKSMVETKEAIEDDSTTTIDDTRKESSEGVYEEGFIVTKDRKYTMEEYMELLVGKDKVSRGLQKISSLSTEDFFDTTVAQLAEISKARGVEVSIESIAKIFNKIC